MNQNDPQSELFNRHTGAALGLILGVVLGSLLLNLNASVVAPAFIHLVQVGPGAAPPLSLTRHGS